MPPWRDALCCPLQLPTPLLHWKAWIAYRWKSSLCLLYPGHLEPAEHKHPTSTNHASRRRSVEAKGPKYQQSVITRFNLYRPVFIIGLRRSAGAPAGIDRVIPEARADIDAWAVSSDSGYTFAGPWKARMGLHVDAASGDEDGDQRAGTVEPLFPRTHSTVRHDHSPRNNHKQRKTLGHPVSGQRQLDADR
ncbi:alginate export family protein [Pseudomonas mohnii]